MKSKIAFGLLAAVALVAGLLIGLTFNKDKPLPINKIQSKLKVSTLLPTDLKNFSDVVLTDQHGKSFNRDSLLGKWQMLFFGYTHCPDICPTTMTTLSRVDSLLENTQAGQDFRVIFISVDPERDSPEHLQKYMNFFNPKFVGLSADHQTLNTLSLGLGVVFQRVENESNPENYLMDHSASLLLADPKGRIVALFSAPHEAESIAEDLQIIFASISRS